MSEPTIEEMIDIVIRQSRWVEDRLALQRSRSALLSRIASIQKEADEWHKMADELAEEFSPDDPNSHTSGCQKGKLLHRGMCGGECTCGYEAKFADYHSLTQRYNGTNSQVSMEKEVRE